VTLEFNMTILHFSNPTEVTKKEKQLTTTTTGTMQHQARSQFQKTTMVTEFTAQELFVVEKTEEKVRQRNHIKSETVGMAPEAKWINCRSMKISTRQWSPESFIGCLQFFLAPTDVKGKNPDPTKRPHTTSHSYGCGANLGCPNPDSMRPASEALEAAGVFMFVSAGNSGPGCMKISQI
jgi:hypothetical protein